MREKTKSPLTPLAACSEFSFLRHFRAPLPIWAHHVVREAEDLAAIIRLRVRLLTDHLVREVVTRALHRGELEGPRAANLPQSCLKNVFHPKVMKYHESLFTNQKS